MASLIVAPYRCVSVPNDTARNPERFVIKQPCGKWATEAWIHEGVPRPKGPGFVIYGAVVYSRSWYCQEHNAADVFPKWVEAWRAR